MNSRNFFCLFVRQYHQNILWKRFWTTASFKIHTIYWATAVKLHTRKKYHEFICIVENYTVKNYTFSELTFLWVWQHCFLVLQCYSFFVMQTKHCLALTHIMKQQLSGWQQVYINFAHCCFWSTQCPQNTQSSGTCTHARIIWFVHCMAALWL